MADDATTPTTQAPGESPETLSHLQILLSHLVVGTGILFMTGIFLGGAPLVGWLLVALTLLCLLPALPAAWRMGGRRPHDLAVLAALIVTAAASMALALSWLD